MAVVGDPTDLKIALKHPGDLFGALGLVSGIYFSWIHPSGTTQVAGRPFR